MLYPHTKSRAMKKLLLLSAFTLLFLSPLFSQIQTDGFGQEYILISKDAIRGDIAFAQMTLQYKNIPIRQGSGIHTKLAGGIVSSFIKKQHRIMFYDEFYCNLSLGKLTSKPLYYYASKEFGIATAFMFGYEALLGYNTNKYAVYGGIRFQLEDAFVGSSHLTGDKFMGFTHPYMIRGEYKIKGSPYYKIVFMAWSNFNSLQNNSGFNLDLPLTKHKRIWLTFQEEYLTYVNSTPGSFGNNEYTPGIFNQWFVGIKVGSLH